MEPILITNYKLISIPAQRIRKLSLSQDKKPSKYHFLINIHSRKGIYWMSNYQLSNHQYRRDLNSRSRNCRLRPCLNTTQINTLCTIRWCTTNKLKKLNKSIPKNKIRNKSQWSLGLSLNHRWLWLMNLWLGGRNRVQGICTILSPSQGHIQRLSVTSRFYINSDKIP